MALLFNRTYAQYVKYRSGVLHAGGLTYQQRRVQIIDNAQAFGQYASQPQGYQSAERATVPSIKTSGFMAAIMRGEAGLSGDVTAQGNMSATLAGEGTTTANANMAWNATATLAGEGTMTPGLTSLGWMSAMLDAGARPSAFDIAQEVLGSVIDSGVNLGDVLKILVAVAAGKTTITHGVGATATVKFRNLGDTKDVIDASMDGSERTGVTLDP